MGQIWKKNWKKIWKLENNWKFGEVWKFGENLAIWKTFGKDGNLQKKIETRKNIENVEEKLEI